MAEISPRRSQKDHRPTRPVALFLHLFWRNNFPCINHRTGDVTKTNQVQNSDIGAPANQDNLAGLIFEVVLEHCSDTVSKRTFDTLEVSFHTSQILRLAEWCSQIHRLCHVCRGDLMRQTCHGPSNHLTRCELQPSVHYTSNETPEVDISSNSKSYSLIPYKVTTSVTLSVRTALNVSNVAPRAIYAEYRDLTFLTYIRHDTDHLMYCLNSAFDRRSWVNANHMLSLVHCFFFCGNRLALAYPASWSTPLVLCVPWESFLGN